jgi:hypothetical protein
MRKIICWVLGHEWHDLEAQYAGELDGRWCERCGKEEGRRITKLT